jgi:hypothetical protein
VQGSLAFDGDVRIHARNCHAGMKKVNSSGLDSYLNDYFRWRDRTLFRWARSARLGKVTGLELGCVRVGHLLRGRDPNTGR